jgi:hypothetical protein
MLRDDPATLAMVLDVLGAGVAPICGGSTSTSLRRAVLAELRALVRQLPHHPLSDLVLAARLGRPELAGLLGEVHEDRTRLEDRDRWATARGVVIDDRGHPVVGTDREERGVELIAASDVEG